VDGRLLLLLKGWPPGLGAAVCRCSGGQLPHVLASASCGGPLSARYVVLSSCPNNFLCGCVIAPCRPGHLRLPCGGAAGHRLPAPVGLGAGVRGELAPGGGDIAGCRHATVVAARRSAAVHAPALRCFLHDGHYRLHSFCIT
jgi:hypothetical protein